MAGSGCRRSRATSGAPDQIPESERDYYLERKYPSFGNLAPRDIASRAAKEACDQGLGVGESGLGVYLDFADADQAPGRADDPRALRQPLRDVSAHHRRESVRSPDADLSRRALHHGRALGRLQPHEHHSRPARHRRSQLLRSRRQPARRQRADAGPGRRLLRPAGHDRRLPRLREAGPGSIPVIPEVRRVEADVAETTRKLLAVKRQAHGGLVPPRAGQDHVGLLRHGPQRDRPPEGAQADSPSSGRSSGAT